MTKFEIREIENAKQKILFLEESKNSVYRELEKKLNLNSKGKLYINEFLFDGPEWINLEEYLDALRIDSNELKISP